MKPVQFDLKINPEALVTRAEEHLHFLRERNTYFENARVDPSRFRCCGIKYLTHIRSSWSGFRRDWAV